MAKSVSVVRQIKDKRGKVKQTKYYESSKDKSGKLVDVTNAKGNRDIKGQIVFKLNQLKKEFDQMDAMRSPKSGQTSAALTMATGFTGYNTA